MTRVSLRSLENLAVRSSLVVVIATSVFFISKSSVTGLKLSEGHVVDSCSNQSGPCHHRVDVDNVIGSAPLEMRSAGFDEEGTCLQVAVEVAS